MKVIWAPWRMEYILSGQKESKCIFCPGDDRGTDAARLILYVGSRSLVMMNRFPYINGHLLVAPVRHVPDLHSLTEEETLDLLLLVQRSIEALKRTMNPEGFNVGLNIGRVAGAGVEDHLHFHIVPRWDGDTNFMPIIAGTKVVSESLQASYQKISAEFKKLFK